MSDPTVLYGMTSIEYHARPELSSSGARTILRSPAQFRWDQDHPVFKDTFDFGSAAHALVLGDPLAELVVVDAMSWRSKAAREERDEARAAGKVPVLASDYTVIETMAAQIRLHPVASALLRPDAGDPEVSVFWEDRRARFDWLPHSRPGRRLIVPDYKTAVSASLRDFSRAVGAHGYHQQAAWYLDALRAMGHEDPAFVFIVQEYAPPYLVNVLELDAEALDIGAALNAQALNLWRRCRDRNEWPGYSTQVQQVALPRWAVIDYEESTA